MFLFFIIVFVAIAILHLPLWLLVKKKRKLIKLDYIFPFAPVLFWIVLSILGFGAQSISNLIEIPFIIIVTLIGYAIIVFADFSTKNIYSIFKYLFSIIILFVFLLRLFMPLLPE